MTSFKFIVMCPECGSRNIVCSAMVYVTLKKSPEGDNLTLAEPYDEDVEHLIGNQKCGCMDCGKTGLLSEWIYEN